MISSFTRLFPPIAAFPAWATTLACLLFLSLSGCATVTGGYDLVTKIDAPLYFQGPGQEAPDAYLEKGTRVKILQSAGNYARVETTRGMRGFVRLSDLQQGPEQAGMGAYGGSSMASPGMF
ncbi:SH3 domain-containing protein [Verrucomicrobium sp. 3C]|uniref:SH3 domain-containing protein n=1 Tax=Verrucomicrobium sp. 3C TaxID=1134055 RepID=UPI00037CAF99|nr:SH3 domain-containing protein [Verrucomicrobium sp. 3C]